jgi:hypothetical protein
MVVPSVTGVHFVACVSIVTRMSIVPGVHVVTRVGRPRPVIVCPVVFAAGMTDLSFADQVVRLVALALVRRAVAFTTGVVVALAHEPSVIPVGRAVFFVFVCVV